jgi:hypothetical protein
MKRLLNVNPLLTFVNKYVFYFKLTSNTEWKEGSSVFNTMLDIRSSWIIWRGQKKGTEASQEYMMCFLSKKCVL